MVKMNFENIRIVFKNPAYAAGAAVSSLILFAIMWQFTSFEHIYWNMGSGIAYAQAFSQAILSILFGINISLLVYKLKYSALFSSKEAHMTSFGAVLGVIVSGCPSCGITFASYIGLASVASALPFFGLELKIIGIMVLLYSISRLSSGLFTCNSSQILH
jgi:hypothetical protein